MANEVSHLANHNLNLNLRDTVSSVPLCFSAAGRAKTRDESPWQPHNIPYATGSVVVV